MAAVVKNSWWLVIKHEDKENTVLPDNSQGYSTRDDCQKMRVELVKNGIANTRIVTVIVSEPTDEVL